MIAPDCGLEHVDDRGAAEVGVGPVDHEQVGEVRDAEAEVGAGALLPARVQVGAVGAGELDGGEELGGREAGAVDDHVDLVDGAVAAAHALGQHLDDRLGDDVDVGLGERGVPLGREQQPLAAERVVGHQLLAQLGVADLGAQLHPPGQLHRLLDRVAAGERAVQLLGEHPGEVAAERLGGGEATEGLAVGAGVLPVRLRHDVRRRALEHRHVAGLGLDAGHELDRAGAGAEDGDALAAQVDRVVPLRGVEGRAGEGVDPRDVAGSRGGRAGRRR